MATSQHDPVEPPSGPAIPPLQSGDAADALTEDALEDPDPDDRHGRADHDKDEAP